MEITINGQPREVAEETTLAKLLEELELFPTWYLQRHKQYSIGCSQWDLWESLCTHLIQTAFEQPQVFVHRDFHSSNLLLLPGEQTGIIDFQDAVKGPLSYDLVSLIWDRYISWPRAQLLDWMEAFRLRQQLSLQPAQWQQYCDWMGLQRNLKIVGIFARLHYRDQKPGYLEMIPRFWAYIMDILRRYPQFQPMLDWLEEPACAP